MLVRSNQELGQTTLMITHNPEAAAVAGRILYMRDGQIVREERGNGQMPPLTMPPVQAAQSEPSSGPRLV
jgi:ABC-type sulfate/molybdate transport systems ATPase subunit